MKIVLDNNLPTQLRRVLAGHVVMPARRMGWDRLGNGELIRAAELAQFDLLITGDKNMFYQQNNDKRQIALVVLSGIRLPDIEAAHEKIVAAVESASPGLPGTFAYVELKPTHD